MARVLLADAEIAALLAEPKLLPPSFERRGTLRARRGHKEAHIDLTTPSGNRYCVILRQSQFNSLDFSAILGYYLTNPKKIFLLTRYNGKSHEHTNSIERETFYDFHIHIATERYQARGYAEEKFAVVTTRYSTISQALDCLIQDCHLVLGGDQPMLLPER